VERYVIVEGRGSVTVGGSLPEEVGPGDVVIIPSMSPQKIENVGPTDLIFLAICSPRFRHEAYEDIEQ
jgi:mannose-6-phosphate isomerase-like protein (cupin superfamily)